jgi:thiamine-monophosphate kinase
MIAEDELIERFFCHAGSTRADVILGIGDDAAVLAPPAGQHIVSTVDTINEGVHFPAGLPARFIGHRAMAVNLSDLAAMGAEPAWASLSLSIPDSDEEWLAEFADGLLGLADRFGVALTGGDTVRGPLSISVNLQGFVQPGQQITRAGARPGDAIFITGATGEAAAGLEKLRTHSYSGTLAEKFLRPEPRVKIGRDLVGYASSAIDLSDGLGVDLGRLMKASGTAAMLDLDRVPLSNCILEEMDRDRARALALAGGDDYELCFTLPQANKALARKIARKHSLAVTCVGEVMSGSGVTLCGEGADAGMPNSWQHFSAVTT